MQKKAICVLPNTQQRPMPRSPVKSKKCLKKAPRSSMDTQGERPQGVPLDFKVFARLDKQARYMKGTLPEGPSWDQVWWRVTREFKTGNIVKSEPIDPSLGEEIVNAPLIDDMDIVTELWYSPTGEVAPSLPTAGAPVGLTPAMSSPAAEPTTPMARASSSSAAASASSKRAGGETPEERSGKRLEMSPSKGQKRPTEPGGETSKPKDRRADPAQATKGTKRPPEDERPRRHRSVSHET